MKNLINDFLEAVSKVQLQYDPKDIPEDSEVTGCITLQEYLDTAKSLKSKCEVREVCIKEFKK